MFKSAIRYLQRLPRQPRAILLTLIYGVGAGVAAVAFQVAINKLYRFTLVELSHRSTTVFLVGSYLILLVSSLLVGFLLTVFCPEAAGSGIPQLKLAFWKDFGLVRWRVVWVKFLAGVISIGGGSSLGREGPSVQLAGGLASNIAGLFGEPKQTRRSAAVAGSAAGLAAAFNTPIAAVTFVLEEIIEDLNSRLLGSVLLAAVVGALVVHGLIGKQPAFDMAEVEPSSWRVYLLIPLVAAAASAVGIFFQKSALELRLRQKTAGKFPRWCRPAVGGTVTWILGVTVFMTTGSLGVFSLGYDDLSTALTQHFDWRIAGVLLATKLAATVFCYGLGGCGGIFSPTLFLGGMSGVLLSGLMGYVVHLTAADHIVLAVIGMSCCLGAVVRAPVTSILIVFEMTHEFSMVPALMLGAIVSQAIGRRLAKHNFYESLLLQDGHSLEHVIPPRDLQSWQQLPISAIANFRPVLVYDLSVTALEKTLRDHPYHNFPVIKEQRLVGVLSRQEATAAIAEKRNPNLQPARTCLPTQTIADLQILLLDSAANYIVLLDQANGKIIGVVTLHDLLRAQVSMAQTGDLGQ